MGADARVKFQVEKILSGLEDVVPRLRNSELVFRLAGFPATDPNDWY